jgi:hypothetical protein
VGGRRFAAQLAETIAGCPPRSRRASTKPRDPTVDTEHSSLYGALRVGGSGTWLPDHRTVHLQPMPENATHPSVLPISGLNHELSWQRAPWQWVVRVPIAMAPL